MFGLDDQLAHLSDGTTLALVLAIALLLGLRHAADPDHLVAVTTLATGERRARRAGGLGLTWGLGHATSLLALGVPIVLYRAYLPAPVQRGIEALVGVVIVALALGLLARWRRGFFEQTHARSRTPLQAYGIGVVHGAGGSAGVGVLLLAAISDRTLALAALALFAIGTAVSMSVLSTGLGLTVTAAPVRARVVRVAPILGAASIAFGVWYTLGALELAPYLL
jgi:hypothetical protein